MDKEVKGGGNSGPMGGTGKTSLEVAIANMRQSRSSAEGKDFWMRLTAGEFEGQAVVNTEAIERARKE